MSIEERIYQALNSIEALTGRVHPVELTGVSPGGQEVYAVYRVSGVEQGESTFAGGWPHSYTYQVLITLLGKDYTAVVEVWKALPVPMSKARTIFRGMQDVFDDVLNLWVRIVQVEISDD